MVYCVIHWRVLKFCVFAPLPLLSSNNRKAVTVTGEALKTVPLCRSSAEPMSPACHKPQPATRHHVNSHCYQNKACLSKCVNPTKHSEGGLQLKSSISLLWHLSLSLSLSLTLYMCRNSQKRTRADVKTDRSGMTSSLKGIEKKKSIIPVNSWFCTFSQFLADRFETLYSAALW